jgi:uncharacterized NAD-dependent epimerase/dehydratase family protein
MIHKPYLLFLGDVTEEPLAKTAFGIRDWAREDIVGQSRLPGCRVDLGLPDLSAEAAAKHGARSLLIGVASIGGAIPANWIPCLLAALEAGLDIVSGMHTRLSYIPEVRQTAERLGRGLHDVRHTDRAFPVATGKKRSGKRLLTVGTDCALGKKYTALAIAQALKARGVDADFRATGQTGIMIAGEGVAIDAVVADFVSGAAETLSPAANDGHWDVIEGQGALFHPGYAGVALGLIHGSQPDAMVLCHDPLRRHLHAYPHYPIVDVETALPRYLEAARLTNPAVRFVGLSLNTSKLDDSEAAVLIAELEERHGLPCFDPMRTSAAALIDTMMSI